MLHQAGSKPIGGGSSVVERWLVIEKLLTLGSILELAMRHCVFGKELYLYFQLGQSSLLIVEAQLYERLATGTKKKLFCIGVVRDKPRVPGSYEHSKSKPFLKKY